MVVGHISRVMRDLRLVRSAVASFVALGLCLVAPRVPSPQEGVPMKQLVSILGLLAFVAISMSCGCTQGACSTTSSKPVAGEGGSSGCGSGQATPQAATADAGVQGQRHEGG